MSTTRAGVLPSAAATVGAPTGHWLAGLTLASVAAFGAILVALHLLRIDVSPLTQGISHYGNGAYRWLLPVANGILGVGGLALALGLAFGVAPAGRSVAGLALLVLWSTARWSPPSSRSTPSAPRRPSPGRSTAWPG